MQGVVHTRRQTHFDTIDMVQMLQRAGQNPRLIHIILVHRRDHLAQVYPYDVEALIVMGATTAGDIITRVFSAVLLSYLAKSLMGQG